ncbi:MAG: AAA family ATPase [Candidatus Paceibacterota bacterium]
MKKSKKLSKNKKLFNVVIIYGTIAVGKFSVATELHKKLNYRFFHNHHTHDLARQLFDRGDFHLDKLIIDMRLLILKTAAEAKINVITTHAYTSDWVSQTGITDPKYMKKVESIIESRGGRACFVYLTADEKELLKRVSGKSRKNFHKLRDKKTMKEFLDTRDWNTPAPVKNNLEINNTKISAKKVADMIIKHFQIRH